MARRHFSPFLLRFYIRALIVSITSMNIGCNYAGIMMNLLAYADDMAFIAPSWHDLQSLLSFAEDAANKIISF